MGHAPFLGTLLAVPVTTGGSLYCAPDDKG